MTESELIKDYITRIPKMEILSTTKKEKRSTKRNCHIFEITSKTKTDIVVVNTSTKVSLNLLVSKNEFYYYDHINNIRKNITGRTSDYYDLINKFFARIPRDGVELDHPFYKKLDANQMYLKECDKLYYFEFLMETEVIDCEDFDLLYPYATKLKVSELKQVMEGIKERVQKDYEKYNKDFKKLLFEITNKTNSADITKIFFDLYIKSSIIKVEPSISYGYGHYRTTEDYFNNYICDCMKDDPLGFFNYICFDLYSQGYTTISSSMFSDYSAYINHFQLVNGRTPETFEEKYPDALKSRRYEYEHEYNLISRITQHSKQTRNALDELDLPNVLYSDDNYELKFENNAKKLIKEFDGNKSFNILVMAAHYCYMTNLVLTNKNTACKHFITIQRTSQYINGKYISYFIPYYKDLNEDEKIIINDLLVQIKSKYEEFDKYRRMAA